MQLLETVGFLFMVGAAMLLLLFTIAWLIQLRTGNAAIVDTIWAISFPLLAIAYFLESNGNVSKSLVFLAMVMIWGIRLATYLFFRTHGHREDIRYTVLREKWGARHNILMLRFYYFQAILALLLSLPFALVMINPAAEFQWVEWLGVGLWVVAVFGESISDQQLKSFKADPSNKGKICTRGLWNYSRHPNYFFEWLIWVSYFVFALGSPVGYFSVICPLLMLYFLIKVTGLPYTEDQMIKSRGHAYIDYQQSTSAFFPLPKRKR